ncbi:MAG: nucleotidyltransferase domain-containing protein [Candidatus Firestonebacteria bacterium]|nr:nucleotidyltransferase domain-containing protein [Candidatus Firestonebacteria bacterium]
MDKNIIEVINKYTDIVKRYIPIEMVVLYGSYAKGTERKYSDIDIAIVVDKIDGNYLEINSNLFNLVRLVDRRIEPVLLDMHNDKSGFLESILKYGKIVYSNKNAA